MFGFQCESIRCGRGYDLTRIYPQEVTDNMEMIYERLASLEERNEFYGVSPLSYVVLDCAR